MVWMSEMALHMHEQGLRIEGPVMPAQEDVT